ncbi:MAG: L-erythro-3,5-diaminohexanoate dehydrogenase [Deltaproteobacteria bacterium]|nr:L-erythro-3,5-diaminohexanoate dehydrogenase [Deltaproteobacteria bacterium]MBI3294827.1 L-erythro-3,5-diaminohexanoate dehydrogenase [Deltaproteobacteria bacterium]
MAEKAVERKGGHRWGLHRVLDKEPRLPQSALHLDNSLPIYSNEILIDVDCLNIDAASFVQMEKETGGDAGQIGRIVQGNSREIGKQQNKVTGSGGMLIGRVLVVGSRYKGPCRFKVGDSVATLVSLTLTPLLIEQIRSVDLKSHQIRVKGHAILFETGIAAKLPSDLPERVVMAAFDVAGAPATVYALCRKGQSVLVVGAGGKAGILSCVAARQKVGRTGRVYAVEPFEAAASDLRKLKVCDAVWQIDATNPVEVAARVAEVTRDKMVDVVTNVASVPNTELSSILSCRSRGKVLLFSMATSFTRAALGAEGIASEATLLFGNGYYPGHDAFVLKQLRRFPDLQSLFLSRYGR